MLTNIIVDKAAARKSVAEFKKRFPLTAKQYRDNLKKAAAYLADGLLWYVDDDTYDIGGPGTPKAVQVNRKTCACGEAMCSHRLAANLAIVYRDLTHVAANEAALEHTEVHAEFQLSESRASYADRPGHQYHGTWHTRAYHICYNACGGIAHRAVQQGPLTFCPSCRAPYCADCDDRVTPWAS